MTPLARCLAEQAAAKAYLDGGGVDRTGAWVGMCDWYIAVTRLQQEVFDFAPVEPEPTQDQLFEGLTL